MEDGLRYVSVLLRQGIVCEKRDLVECRIRPAGKESVQLGRGIRLSPHEETFKAYLDEEEKVWVLALWGGPVALLDVVLLDVDTLGHRQRCK